MSVTFITEHNESIYYVQEKPKEKIVKPPMHVSSFSKNLKDGFKMRVSDKGKTHLTMGLPQYLPEYFPNPQNYLKKHSVKKMPSKPKKRSPKKIQLGVPAHNEYVKKKRECVNFVVENIKSVKKLQPPPIEPKFVDSSKGAKIDVAKSGLINNYTRQKHLFGKPPAYLVKKIQKNEYKQTLKKDAEEIKSLPKCQYLTRQERDELLNGLKENWEILQKEFQLLPMITDTIPKIMKKVKLEKSLQELEKDIHLIEKHPFIYIDYEDRND